MAAASIGNIANCIAARMALSISAQQLAPPASAGAMKAAWRHGGSHLSSVAAACDVGVARRERR